MWDFYVLFGSNISQGAPILLREKDGENLRERVGKKTGITSKRQRKDVITQRHTHTLSLFVRRSLQSAFVEEPVLILRHTAFPVDHSR